MEFSDLLIIYLYSYFPAIMLGAFFWWMDRFERESLFLVVFCFLWGAYGSGLLSYFWNTFFHLFLLKLDKESYLASDVLSTIIVAPFVEEFTKGVIILILLKLNKVDNITDGILLGIIIGLGFAASENVFYAEDRTYATRGELAMWYNLWFRELHTTLLHACATAVWGGMIGYSRHFKGIAHYFMILNGFILAMVTHGFWNTLASISSHIQSADIVRTFMQLELVIIFGTLLTMFLLSVRDQSKLIIKELLEESEKGVIPKEHIGFFASLVRHPDRYKLPKNTTPKEYAHLGVRLAFRKHDYEHNPSTKLLLEIENLRERLRKSSEYKPDSLQLQYGR